MAEGETTPESLPQLLVLGSAFFSRLSKQFSQKFDVLKPWESPDTPLEQFLSARARTVTAVLCSASNTMSVDVLRHLPSLRLIVTTSAGLDHIDLHECRRRGIAVANSPGVFSADVADLAVGLLIDVLRRISDGNRFVNGGNWPVKGDYYPLGSKLGGKQVGIVGLGSIGLAVAKRLEAFGCSVSYHSRKQKSSVPYHFYPDVHELAANCVILVICCALTEKTYHLIDKEVLSKLGKGGVIINIARGAVIDEKELVQFLLRGEIAAAGLDVFEDEPNVPGELCELSNVVLSPHCAAVTDESFRELYELICGNLEAFLSNRPLLSPVVDE